LTTTSDQSKYAILCELGYQYLIVGDYDEAMQYSNQLINIGTNERDSLQLVRGLAIKASMQRRSGLVDSALHLYNELYPIAKRNFYEEEWKNISNSLGLLYTYHGYFDKALRFLFESLAIADKQKNRLSKSVAFHNIGLVYYKLQDMDKALEFYEKSDQLKIDMGDNTDREVLFINISLCYTRKGDFVRSEEFLDNAFKVAGENGAETDYFLTSAYYARGFKFFCQRVYDKAEEEFLRSYSLSQTINNTRFQLDNLVFLADVCIRKYKVELAEEYLRQAERIIANDSRYKNELAEVYAQFSVLYHNTKDYKKIVFYQDKLLTLNDSIFNDEMTTNLMKVEAGYVEREHKSKIEAQNNMLALNEEIIYRQKLLNLFMGIIALLVIVLSLVLARSNKQKRLMNELLDTKVKERTQELELSRDEVQRVWQERDILMSKVANDVRGSLATLKGLCFLSLNDIEHENIAEYLVKLDLTVNRLNDNLDKIISSPVVPDPVHANASTAT
jgi:tetratricopeptide (TPR) repeat protein